MRRRPIGCRIGVKHAGYGNIRLKREGFTKFCMNFIRVRVVLK